MKAATRIRLAVIVFALLLLAFVDYPVCAKNSLMLSNQGVRDGLRREIVP